MGSSVLDHKTLITLHALENMWFLYGPLSNICPFLVLVRTLCVLLCVRRLPSGFPVICELFDEVCFDSGRL
jgi:hypothetical protein